MHRRPNLLEPPGRRALTGHVRLLNGAAPRGLPAESGGCEQRAKPRHHPLHRRDLPKRTTGGDAEVKVEGQDLAGLDSSTVTCVKQAGKINVASGSATGGLGVVMTDEATPKVESLGLTVDGNALAVASMGGMNTGSADVKVDGSTYTITGEAAGGDMK